MYVTIVKSLLALFNISSFRSVHDKNTYTLKHTHQVLSDYSI